MVDDLGYAIDTVSGDALERLLPGFLRERGYNNVKETSPSGTDGGVDAYADLDGEKGIAHASKRKDWRAKIRDDAEKVRKLEKDGETVDFMIFLTNRDPSETQVRSMETEIADKYGWDLRLYHRTNLMGTLESQDPPQLAERYLGVDLSTDTERLEEIESLVDGRIETIEHRQGPASSLVEGPAVALHLIPSGIFSGDYVDTVDQIPSPPNYARLDTAISPEVTGDGKYATGVRGPAEYTSYTYLRKDGLFEAVGTDCFLINDREDPPSKSIRNDPATHDFLDKSLVISTKSGLNALQRMSVNGSVQAVVTLLGVKSHAMTGKLSDPLSSPPSFKTNRYRTDLTTGEVAWGEYDGDGNTLTLHSDSPVFNMLRPVITQYWQEAGRAEGSPHYDDSGEWNKRGYSIRL